MNWLSVLKVLAPYFIGALIAGIIVGKIQQSRIDSRNATIEVLTKQLEDCRNVNVETQKTIVLLKEEVVNVVSTCQKRINAKDILLKKLQQVDNISGNVLTDELNRMFGNTAADNKD